MAPYIPSSRSKVHPLGLAVGRRSYSILWDPRSLVFRSGNQPYVSTNERYVNEKQDHCSGNIDGGKTRLRSSYHEREGGVVTMTL